jgi:hypothetical protein
MGGEPISSAIVTHVSRTATRCPDALCMAPAITIREATPRDYEQIASFRSATRPLVAVSGGGSRRGSSAGFMGTAVSIKPEKAKQQMLDAKVGELVRGTATALVAVAGNDKILGTVDCKMKSASDGSKYIFIKNMFVVEEAR